MRAYFSLLVPVLTFVTGLGLGVFWQGGAGGDAQALVCRPSSPEQLTEEPAILFWGNSLAFDYGWSIPGHVAVNCAVQGMTAQRAAKVTSYLPDIKVSSVVLVFGTVELLRMTEPSEFAAGLQSMRATLEQKYPKARIITAGIPEGAGWRYAKDARLPQLNAILQELEGAEFLDLSEALSEVPDPSQSYDGVHLSAQSYAAAERALQAAIGE